MSRFLQDARYGVRMLLKNPAFTIITVAALALGIGANTAIFSVVNSILLRPMAYKDAERLVLLNHNYPKLDLKASVSAVGYAHYREVNKSFDNITAFSGWPVNLTDAGEPERLTGAAVTATFFPTLGVDAAMGRTFIEGEDQEGRNKLIVVSDGLWKRRFGSDPNLIGRDIVLNGESYKIVGIMPASFQFGKEFGQDIELWRPIAFTQDQMQTSNWRNEFLTVIARLKQNVTLQQAQAEMDAVAFNIRKEYFKDQDASDSSSWNLLLRGVHEIVVGDIRPALLVLMGAVGMVLLIACANVANLLLARAASRQKEMAIRAALGAGRLRIITQLLTESVLLSLLGGGLGLLLAWWGVSALVALNKSEIPRAHEISLDGRVLLFTLAVSLFTGILFGLAPALFSSKTDLHESLKEGGRTGAAHSRRGLRSVLATAEVAIALVLLIGAGLLIKSFLSLQEVNPGFNPQNLLVMQVALPNSQYPEPQQRDGFFQQMLEKVRALPGVQSAGISTSVPMSGFNSSGSFRIEGREVRQGEMMPWGNRWFAGTDYFKSMGIPLVKGRFFEDRDAPDAPLTAVIDETMAKKFWQNEDPVGKRISFERDKDGNPRWREIVGVVGHVKQKGLEGESPVQYYVPHRQIPIAGVFLVVRTEQEPSSLSSSVRAAIQSVDKELPVFKVTTMEKMVSESMSQRRFAMLLLVVFAAAAFLLAALGLYGVMSYTVEQRTHEIGIRMALGAKQSDIVKMVVINGMLLALIGVGIGLLAAFALTRLMKKLLFEVSATDPVTFAAIAVMLTAVAIFACYIPARRAMKVDPMIALRYE